MLLEALEILQSAGEDTDTFVTDFGIYKVVVILTIYLQFFLATFLLSQEYLGEKIACFTPDNFTDSQASAANEFCWNNGFWVADGVPMEKNLYTQPHRYYPLYLPIQALAFASPIIIWNVLTKARLMAILRGTEEFLENLISVTTGGGADKAADWSAEDEGGASSARMRRRARLIIRQFHETCMAAAESSQLAAILAVRVVWEMTLCAGAIALQFYIYDSAAKTYHCRIPGSAGSEVRDQGSEVELLCTVPVLDILDIVWSINLGALLITAAIIVYVSALLVLMHRDAYSPLFYQDLPYGSQLLDVQQTRWRSRWTKDSYELLTRIFEENNSVMTKAYVLGALRVELDTETRGSDSATDQSVNGSSCQSSPSTADYRHPATTDQSLCAAPDHVDVSADKSLSRLSTENVVGSDMCKAENIGGVDKASIQSSVRKRNNVTFNKDSNSVNKTVTNGSSAGTCVQASQPGATDFIMLFLVVFILPFSLIFIYDFTT